MNTIEKYKKYVNISMVEKVQPVVIEKAQGAMISEIIKIYKYYNICRFFS
jgi:hypothetical protein